MTQQDTATDRGWGALDPPAEPPAPLGLRIDPRWSGSRLILAIIHSVWRLALSGAILRAIFNIASVLLPVAVGRMIDSVIAPATRGAGLGEILSPMFLWIGAIVGLYVLIHLGYRFGGRLGWYGVQRAQHELSQQTLGRILDERGMAEPTPPPGRLLSLATADTRAACQSVYIAVYPPGELLGLLAAAVVLFTVHPLLGLGVAVALPLVLGLMHLIAQPLRRRSMGQQAGVADAAAAAADLVAGFRVIRGLHAQHTASDRYRTTSRQALRATLAARSAQAAFDGASTAIGMLFVAAVSVGAALLAFSQKITVGELVTVSSLSITLIGPLDSLIGTLGSMWAKSQASARRVLDLLSTPQHAASSGTVEHSGQDALPNVPATLEFRDLRLAEGLELTAVITPGEFVVLDLPHQGRERLSRLLGLIQHPETGDLRYEGRPLSDFRPAALRRRILLDPHLPGLLSGTVLDNVRAHGEEPGSTEAAQNALAAAGISEAELPAGYETLLGDGARQLSGGQRQRIALARALTADPEVLILNAPTSSVDAVTEQGIATALQRHRAGRTTIVMTTSPAFSKVADRVITTASLATGWAHRV